MDFDAVQFARSYQQFLAYLMTQLPAATTAAETLKDRVKRHLGVDPSQLPSFAEKLDSSEHQALQLAINALSQERPWDVVGLGEAHHYSGFSLVSLLSGRMSGWDRGKVITYGFSEYGQVSLTFARLPVVSRADIVLPEADREAIERHTVGLSRRAEALRATGQHLKRGLLLYGPPGTGHGRYLGRSDGRRNRPG